MDRDSVIRLLVEVLRGTAPLRDAACRHRGDLFDDLITEPTIERTERLSTALAICHRCPARLACSTLATPALGRGGVAVQGGPLLAGPELQRPAVA